MTEKKTSSALDLLEIARFELGTIELPRFYKFRWFYDGIRSIGWGFVLEGEGFRDLTPARRTTRRRHDECARVRSHKSCVLPQTRQNNQTASNHKPQTTIHTNTPRSAAPKPACFYPPISAALAGPRAIAERDHGRARRTRRRPKTGRQRCTRRALQALSSSSRRVPQSLILSGVWEARSRRSARRQR